MSDTLRLASNSFGVRRASPSDAEALFDFLIPVYAESALQPVSPTKLRAMINRCVNLDSAICGIISGKDGIEASIGLLVGEFDYTDHPHVAIKWNAVHPNFRRVNHGATLMRFAKWCYDGLQADSPVTLPMFAEVLTKDALEAKMRLLERNIPQVGAWFAWGCAPEGRFDQLSIAVKGRPQRRADVAGTRTAAR